MGSVAQGWRGSPPKRASDAERERAARALHRHFAEGRLEIAELEARLEGAWSARSRGDLAVLFRDLPAQRGRRALERFAAFQRRLLTVHAAGYVGVNGTLVAIWSLTGGEFWPAWALVPGTAALSWHAGGTYLLSRAVRDRSS